MGCGCWTGWWPSTTRADRPTMADIGFYHLTRGSPEAALPALLGRTLAAGQRALVACDSAARLTSLDAALWLTPDWLPHGGSATGDAPLQPIWLTAPGEAPAPAPNAARFLFCLEGAGSGAAAAFDRVFDLFDGADAAAVAAARLRWAAAKTAGHRLVYWQQAARGWEKKG